MSALTPEEIVRYQRHLTLPQFGEEAQLKLKASRVLVIGAGGLGCPALQYLAAAGVGRLGIVDFDRVDVSNLQRQILFTEDDVGMPKAEVAARRLKRMNPCIEVEAIEVRFGADNALEILRRYDVIVDGSDNFPTRYLVNDACVLAGKPLIYGAIYTFQGQVSVFNFQDGPTYRCLFAQPPDPEDAPSCSEIGVLGVLPGIIGTAQACEAIKVITGVGEPLSGKLLMWDALSMKQEIIKISRDHHLPPVTELREIEFACNAPDLPDSAEIETRAFKSLLQGGTPVQVLDVRHGWERAMAKIDSVHIPLGDLSRGRVDPREAGLDPKRPTVVYCRSGFRSLKARNFLADHYSFSQVYSLKGGINQWAREFDTSLRVY